MPDTDTEYRLAQILQIDIKLAERVLEVVSDMEQDIFPDHETVIEGYEDQLVDLNEQIVELTNERDDLNDCLKAIRRIIENLI